ncbi:MAG: NTP transferase domain-containing protein [Chloroflexi bacterium]|nr:NTP transferase domain-containing protein [Chloroflexota bacterium]
MQGVILAAGKGSRLHPITTTRSKAMLPILGKPIVERVMESISIHGITDFVLVVSCEDKEIVQYFEQECKLPVTIQFVVQEQRRGMADALRQAAPLIHEPFILSACDNLVNSDHVGALIRRFNQPDANAVLTLMVIPPAQLGKTGIVDMKNEYVTRIIEKPPPEEAPTNIASLPLYIFPPRILDFLPEVKPSPRGEYELQDAIQMLIDRVGNVAGVFIESRLTLTGPEDLLAINRHYLMAGQDQPQLAPFTVGPGTHLVTPLRIEQNTVIGANCVIGPRVYIEKDCRIGTGVTIKDAVVLRGAVIADNAMIIGEVIS